LRVHARAFWKIQATGVNARFPASGGSQPHH
jgi:hypothetical protein